MGLGKMTVVAVGALALAACSGTGDDEEGTGAVPTPIVEATTTTVAMAADEDFVAAFEAGGGTDPQWREWAVEAAHTMCTSLGTTESLYADDGANDTPEGDAAAAQEMSVRLLDVSWNDGTEAGVPEETIVLMLQVGAEQFCPNYAQYVTDYLADR